MYCQSCGTALTQKTKYCNRCGAQLVPGSDVSLDKKRTEKRLDEYLEGLFWTSVFGLGLIAGGTVLLHKTNVRDLIVLGYLILSTTVFLINFGFNMWGTLRIMRSSQDVKLEIQPGPETHELNPPKIEPLPISVGSVTEHTTRSFEPRRSGPAE